MTIFFSTAHANSPRINNLAIKDTDNGLEVKFLFSDIIDNNNIKGWIDRERWIVLNMYNVAIPDDDFF